MSEATCSEICLHVLGLPKAGRGMDLLRRREEINSSSRSQLSAPPSTRLPLELDAYDSRFVVFRKLTATNENHTAPNSPVWQQAQVIGGPWDVTFNPKWGGPVKPVCSGNLTD